MRQVWCSKDKPEALTKAKNGEKLDSSIDTSGSCADPVTKYYNLGSQMGVRGTPAVFTATGKQIGGYLPADAMLNVLKQEDENNSNK